MLDGRLRPLKESILEPVCRLIPAAITPTHLTLAAFLLGLASCYAAAAAAPAATSAEQHANVLPVALWLLNRLFDSLDGSLARSRGLPTEAGGFLDLLCDFIVYSLIPLAVAQGQHSSSVWPWKAVAFLEASFHINNFVLLYVAAVEAKLAVATATTTAASVSAAGRPRKSELTSLMMKPALIEGAESAVFFTAMLAFPRLIASLSWLMGAAVMAGSAQRVLHVWPVLVRIDSAGSLKSA